jgi:hypothetical protein
VADVLRSRGYRAHVHGDVAHHHVYRGACVCGETHLP